MKKGYSLLKMPLRIFIGSSSEALPLANWLFDFLKGGTECVTWNREVFESGKSYFETLNLQPNLFDFAVFLATKDDRTTSRKKRFDSPRDNILFEFGLFMGRLSRNKVFIIQEKGVKMPGDVLGVELPAFERSNKNEISDSFKNACAELKRLIKKRKDQYDYTLIPSTALAQGYFSSFVSKVCEQLSKANSVWLKEEKQLTKSSKKIDIKLKEWKTFKLIVAVPGELPDDLDARIQTFRTKKHLKNLEVFAGNRDYNFYINAEQPADEELHLYDMPTTLVALKHAISRYVPASFEGEEDIETLLIKRGLKNFIKTLRFLVSKNDYTKDRVIVQVADI